MSIRRRPGRIGLTGRIRRISRAIYIRTVGIWAVTIRVTRIRAVGIVAPVVRIIGISVVAEIRSRPIGPGVEAEAEVGKTESAIPPEASTKASMPSMEAPTAIPTVSPVASMPSIGAPTAIPAAEAAATTEPAATKPAAEAAATMEPAPAAKPPVKAAAAPTTAASTATLSGGARGQRQ